MTTLSQLLEEEWSCEVNSLSGQVTDQVIAFLKRRFMPQDEEIMAIHHRQFICFLSLFKISSPT